MSEKGTNELTVSFGKTCPACGSHGLFSHGGVPGYNPLDYYCEECDPTHTTPIRLDGNSNCEGEPKPEQPHSHEQTEATMSENETTNQFSVGDKVRHRASGETGIVAKVHYRCINDTHRDSWFGHRIVAFPDPNDKCELRPTGRYDVETGFGRVIEGVPSHMLEPLWEMALDTRSIHAMDQADG